MAIRRQEEVRKSNRSGLVLLFIPSFVKKYQSWGCIYSTTSVEEDTAIVHSSNSCGAHLISIARTGEVKPSASLASYFDPNTSTVVFGITILYLSFTRTLMKK